MVKEEVVKQKLQLANKELFKLGSFVPELEADSLADMALKTGKTVQTIKNWIHQGRVRRIEDKDDEIDKLKKRILELEEEISKLRMHALL